MKMKLFAAAAAIAASAYIAAAAQNDYGAQITSADSDTVTITSDSDQNGRLIFAQYDIIGRLKSVEEKEVTLNSGSNTLAYSQLGISDVSEGTKLMLLRQNGWEPLSEAEYIEDAGPVTQSSILFSSYVYDAAGDCLLFDNASANDDILELEFSRNRSGSEAAAYNVLREAEIYVNGFFVNRDIEYVLTYYFINTNASTITMTDTSQDGIYDRIDISYYAEGLVDSTYESNGNTTVFFDLFDGNISGGKAVLNSENCTVTLEGETVPIAEIHDGDILSISYDVNDSFRNAEHYEIIIGRTAEENVKITGVYEDEEHYGQKTLYGADNSKVYSPAFDLALDISAGNTYTLYLDAFGDIAAAKVTGFDTSIGILENVYSENGRNYAAVLGASGSRNVYMLSEEAHEELYHILTYFGSDIRPVEERVIMFKADASGSIIEYSHLDGYSIRGEFKYATGKLDGRQLSEALTEIADISGYAEAGTALPFGYNDFITDTEYEGYVYGRVSSERIFRFVLIMGGTGYNVADPLAVFAGMDGGSVNAYVNGELVTLASTVDISMNTGDAFFYRTNSEGAVSDIRPVTGSVLLSAGYDSFFAAALEKNLNIIDPTTAAQFSDKKADGAFNGDLYESKLVSGAIMDDYRGSIKLALGDSANVYAIDSISSYPQSEKMNVYVYDCAAGTVTKGDASDIKKSQFLEAAYVGDNTVDLAKEYELEQSADKGCVNFAIAKIVGGRIEDILVIRPDGETSSDTDPTDNSLHYGLLEDMYNREGACYAKINANEYPVSETEYAVIDSILHDENGGIRALQERVISYSVTEKGDADFTAAKAAAGTAFSGIVDKAAYSIGTKHVDENTLFLDVIDYDINGSCLAVPFDELADNISLTGYAYGMSGSDRVYSLMLITDGIGYHVENPIAVFVEETTVADNDNNDVAAISVYMDGMLMTFPVKIDISEMRTGDVFFFRLNSEHEIYDIRMVTKVGSLDRTYQEYLAAAVEAGFDMIDPATAAQFSDASTEGAFLRETDDCKLIAGPIIERDYNNGEICIVTPDELVGRDQSIEAFMAENIRPYRISPTAQIYEYDYSTVREKDRVEPSFRRNIRRSTFDRGAYVGDKADNVINFKAEAEIESELYGGTNYGDVTFAIAKAVGGEITEMLVIFPEAEN